MPTYDYECKACGPEFEKFQSMSAGVLRKCPSCGRLMLRRLIGAGAGLIFKGSGVDETDDKRKSMRSPAGSEAAKESGTSDSSSDNGKADKSETASKSGSNGKPEKKKD